MYLLKPTNTCPNVPRPISFPFFQRDPGLAGWSALPGLRGIEDGVFEVELVGEKGEGCVIFIGGNGSRWLSFFPSSGLLVGDSGAVPPALG